MIKEQINKDIAQAMKMKEPLVLETLRMVKSAFTSAETEKNAGEFNDAKAVQIMQKLVKQREETARLYQENGRLDLYTKENSEADIIKKYLPQEISTEQLHQTIHTTIIQHPEFKMGEVIKDVKRRIEAAELMVDGKLLSQMVKEQLA